MGFRNISAMAIRNPVPPIVLFIALTLAGIVSFIRLDVNQNPEITFPGVVVVIQQPGAAPSELETQIAQIVESSMRNLEGVEEIQTTINEGSSETFIQFTIETPIDRAVTDVRDAIAQVRGQLPDGIIEPQVIRAQVNGGASTRVTTFSNSRRHRQTRARQSDDHPRQGRWGASRRLARSGRRLRR